MSPGATCAQQLGRIGAQGLLVDAALAVAQAAAVPRVPCRWLWIRLVTRKKSGPPADHHPAGVHAGASRIGQERLSISATPPPLAVELTCQTARRGTPSRLA